MPSLFGFQLKVVVCFPIRWGGLLLWTFPMPPYINIYTRRNASSLPVQYKQHHGPILRSKIVFHVDLYPMEWNIRQHARGHGAQSTVAGIQSFFISR